MALNEKALALITQRRQVLNTQLAELELDLVRAWVDAWDQLAYDFEAAMSDLLLQAQNGRVTGIAVGRNVRLQQALERAAATLDGLADTAEGVASAASRQLVLSAAQTQLDTIRAQLPADHVSYLAPSWTRVDPAALDVIVARTGQTIHQRLIPLSDEAVAAMKKSLLQGIVVGENPRRVAAAMVRKAEKGFNGGLTRAMVIARTELLDANRAANKAAEQLSKDVVKGWMWVATLDSKTCPSCISQHGSEHPTDEDGPLDHHQGRCDRAPITKSWKELGFDIEEPPSLVPDAQEWFDSLTPGTQRDIMGPARLKLLQDGDITLADLSTKRSTPGWRDSMHVTPVRDLSK